MNGPLFLVAYLLQYNGCGPPPAYNGPGDQPPPLQGDPGPTTPSPRTPGPNRPGPDTPGPANPGPRTPGTPGSPAGPRTGGPAGGGIRTGAQLDLGPDLDWRDWWWLNGYEYFRPTGHRGISTGGDGAVGASATLVDRELLLARELVRKAAEDSDDRVRASAALTAGRIYEPSLGPMLLKLLDDKNPLVRQSAIAGLGLAGADEHVPLLLELGIASKRAKTTEERDLALLSLGIASFRGSSAPFAGELRGFLAKASGNDRRALGPSAALSVGLAKDDAGLAELATIAKDNDAPPAVRARALWSFRNHRPFAKTNRPIAIACLKDRDPDVRRAAALALGRLGVNAQDDVVAELRATIERDGDTAVRAFALLAMGEVGGPAAKKELTEHLTRGKLLLRPWAGIALGLLGRKNTDAEVGRTLARALIDEKNRDTRAAIALGAGLARATDARETVRKLITDGEGGRERVFAAVATALAGDEEARPILRQAIADIPSPGSKATTALALATFGHAEDVATLLDLYHSVDDAGVIGTAAMALGWHGSAPTFEALRKEAETAKQAERRAIAILALGLGLSDERVPVSVAATAGWDYMASLEASHTAARLWM